MPLPSSPLAVVALPRPERARLVALAAVVAVAGWALVVGVSLRAPAPESLGARAVAEQRPFYVDLAGTDHPVTLADWEASPLFATGAAARTAHAADRDVLLTAIGAGGVALPAETALAPGRGTWLFIDGIGVAGSAAGVDVAVLDFHGLADPVASRLPVARPRGLPGHEKALPAAWALAAAGPAVGPVPDPGRTEAAVVARECGDLGRLLDAVDGPVTPGRFLANLAEAWTFTRLTVAPDPTAAARSCVPG